MESKITARLKNYGTFLGRCALVCLLCVSAPSLARASSDPCFTGYWDGSSQDVDACATLAKAGGPNAEFGYALILWSGHDRPEDHKAALDWFRMSARQGHALAQITLGRFLSDPNLEQELRNPVEGYAWWFAAGATSSANKLLATLSQSDAGVAKKLGDEFKAKYGRQRPTPTGP
jgi:TPR repeat protein